MSWITKGIVLSIWLFSFGWLFSVVRLHLIGKKLSGSSGPGMLGVEVLLPVSNPSFWLWLGACLAIGLLIARSWPGRPALWIGLAVTEVIPVGVLTLILVLLNRTRAMMK